MSDDCKCFTLVPRPDAGKVAEAKTGLEAPAAVDGDQPKGRNKWRRGSENIYSVEAHLVLLYSVEAHLVLLCSVFVKVLRTLYLVFFVRVPYTAVVS